MLYSEFYTNFQNMYWRTHLVERSWKENSLTIWNRLKPFYTSVLALLIFQSDIIGFSALSNADSAYTYVSLKMTLKLHAYSASLINIVTIKTTSDMSMTRSHESYIIQTNKKESKIIAICDWMKKPSNFERGHFRDLIRQENTGYSWLNVFLELFRPNKCLTIYSNKVCIQMLDA